MAETTELPLTPKCTCLREGQIKIDTRTDGQCVLCVYIHKRQNLDVRNLPITDSVQLMKVLGGHRSYDDYQCRLVSKCAWIVYRSGARSCECVSVSVCASVCLCGWVEGGEKYIFVKTHACVCRPQMHK